MKCKKNRVVNLFITLTLILLGGFTHDAAATAGHDELGSNPPLGAIRLQQVKVLPALVREMETLHQPIRLRVVNTGSTPRRVTLNVGEATQQVDLIAGESWVEVRVPKESINRELKTWIREGQKIVCDTILQVTPVKEWQVNFVQHTHTDIGDRKSTRLNSSH